MNGTDSATDPFSIATGARIAAAREAAGMSQADLAEKIGQSRTTLVHVETGRRAPKIERLARIAEALEVTTDELLGMPVRSSRDEAWQIVADEVSGGQLDKITKAQMAEIMQPVVTAVLAATGPIIAAAKSRPATRKARL